MTNTNLKAQIDSQITNETTENGITPAEVGGNLKAIVDYVDQESKKILKVTLSSAEILNLRTNPKVLFPAELGKLFVIDFIHYVYNHVSASYTTGGNLSICYGNVSQFVYNFANIIDSTENTYGFSTANYATIKQTSFVNTNVLLTTGLSNPTTGDGNLELYISYKEITL